MGRIRLWGLDKSILVHITKQAYLLLDMNSADKWKVESGMSTEYEEDDQFSKDEMKNEIQ